MAGQKGRPSLSHSKRGSKYPGVFFLKKTMSGTLSGLKGSGGSRGLGVRIKR